MRAERETAADREPRTRLLITVAIGVIVAVVPALVAVQIVRNVPAAGELASSDVRALDEVANPQVVVTEFLDLGRTPTVPRNGVVSADVRRR